MAINTIKNFLIMLTYTQETTTIISGNWSVFRIEMNFNEHIVTIVYNCCDTNNLIIDTFVVNYFKEDSNFGWNYFWDNFNDGSFLISELIRNKNWKDVKLPEDLEKDFIV